MRFPFGWFAALSLTACVTFNPQSRFVQRTYFPSPPPPEAAIELPTPAFSKAQGFTKHDELMAFVEALATEHADVATLTQVGTSQRGRDIPMLRLVGADPKVRVFFQGGLHGNEPAGTEGLLLLVHRLLNDPEFRPLLDGVDLAVIPVANPDGFEHQMRHAANGLDLNRDQTKLEIEESHHLKRAFHDFNPDVAVDFHEYRPYRRDFALLGTNGITNPYDVMFLYSGNLNVPEPLRDLTRSVFVDAVRDEMDDRGLRHHDYVVSRSVHGDIWFNQGSVQARSSATHFALAHSVSLLVEVRGVALGRHAFERRVLSTFWVAERVLKTATANAERIRDVLQQSVGLPEKIAVVQEPGVVQGTLKAIDLAEHAMVDLEVTVRNHLASTATQTRTRPQAYAVLPAAEGLLEKIERLGLQTVRLDAPTELEVERYAVREVRREPHRYEGQRQQSVTVDVEASPQTLPEGTYLVRLDRPGANLAFELFEPEAPNSFVAFGVVRVKPNSSLPFVRVMGGADALLSPSKP
ncbi:MAG: M14 family zinc carboxypeptidase [Myxococcota bacterium]